MSDWQELRSIALANVRRLERAPSEAWEHQALEIARAFLALFSRDDLTRADTAPLLRSVAALPTRDSAGLRESLICGHLALPAFAFVAPPIAPGDLVVDAHGRLDVIMRRAPTPTTKWLAEQEVPPPSGETTWWSGWPLDGGAVVLAEPQVFSLGRADRDRVWELVEHATVDQVRELLTLFPGLARR